MTRKTESHPHFQHAAGSTFSTRIGFDGSISCTVPVSINGTIYYISEGIRRRESRKQSDVGPASVLAFPLHRHHASVARVATKLASLRTHRHANYYRAQVSQGLNGRLERRGVFEGQRKREIARFWQAVLVEMERQRRAGGAA